MLVPTLSIQFDFPRIQYRLLLKMWLNANDQHSELYDRKADRRSNRRVFCAINLKGVSSNATLHHFGSCRGRKTKPQQTCET